MFIDATSLHGDAHEASTLARRQYIGGGGFGNGYNNGYYGSSWDRWGRWVLLGVIIVVFIIFFLGCSCWNARKRRKRGAQPMYGTGWMAGQHGTPQYYGNHNENNTPAQPAVGQNYYGGYNQANDAAPAYNQYGGGQNSGYYGQATELQQPSNAYQPARGGDTVYSPPSGPPPSGKGDIV